ncbi:MAG TPA: hypothetical protein VKZ18_08665 [Polyangia bacterium]|nr:hypothetical protein [Polyangia bacterium]
MDRLVDIVNRPGESAGPDAELAALVESCEPVRVSEARKQRTLEVVYARHHERRRTVRSVMRLAMAGVVLLAAGAATAAAFGVRFRPAPAAVVTFVPPPHHIVRTPRPEPPPVAAPAAELEAAPAPAPELAPVPARRSHQVRSEDPSLVVSAIQALRQDQDPVRAGRLLAAYLRTQPHGALAEEAVALSIEAADARHSAAAVGFAQRYLKDYPHGRFRSTAERVLARPTL